jgi:hypothetical protein
MCKWDTVTYTSILLVALRLRNSKAILREWTTHQAAFINFKKHSNIILPWGDGYHLTFAAWLDDLTSSIRFSQPLLLVRHLFVRKTFNFGFTSIFMFWTGMVWNIVHDRLWTAILLYNMLVSDACSTDCGCICCKVIPTVVSPACYCNKGRTSMPMHLKYNILLFFNVLFLLVESILMIYIFIIVYCLTFTR